MSPRTRPLLASVARPGTIVAGGLALAASTFLIAGMLLPSTVEVTRAVDVEASPETIFPFLDDLRAWMEWTPWSEVASRLEGTPSGPGASRVWDDPRFGTGSLTLVRTRPPASQEGPAGVDYLVELEGGAITFSGTIALEDRGAAARVVWTEQADLGWNPLLGWTALGMEESQGQQLEESLSRLKALAEGRPVDIPPTAFERRCIPPSPLDRFALRRAPWAGSAATSTRRALPAARFAALGAGARSSTDR